MISKKKINIFPSYGLGFAGKLGQFATLSKNNKCGAGHACRESFAGSFNKNRNKIIFSSSADWNKIDEFWEQLEDKLKLKNKTIFNPTDHAGVYVVELSDFWINSAMRRGLVTMFLRAATYFKFDFDVALNQYHLTRDCKKAINHFLNGNVKPTGVKTSSSSIADMLSYKNDKWLREHLVKKGQKTLDDYKVIPYNK